MAVGSVAVFRPLQTLTLAASTSPTSGEFTTGGGSVGGSGGGDAVMIYNATSSIAFVRLGFSQNVVAATVNDTPVPPGGQMLFAGGPYVDTVSVILSASAGNVYATLANGTAH